MSGLSRVTGLEWFNFTVGLAFLVWACVVWYHNRPAVRPLWGLARQVAWIGFAVGLLHEVFVALERAGPNPLDGLIRIWSRVLVALPTLAVLYLTTFAFTVAGTFVSLQMGLRPFRFLRVPLATPPPPRSSTRSFVLEVLGVALGWLALYYVLHLTLVPGARLEGTGQLGRPADFAFAIQDAALYEPLFRLLVPVLLARALGGTRLAWGSATTISAVLGSLPFVGNSLHALPSLLEHIPAGFALVWLFRRHGLEAPFFASLLYLAAILLGLPFVSA